MQEREGDKRLPSACSQRATGGQSCKETETYTPDSVVCAPPSHLPGWEGEEAEVEEGGGGAGIFTNQLQ